MDIIKTFLKNEEGVHTVFTKEVLESYSAKGSHLVQLMQNGFFAKRSGDIFFIVKPGWYPSIGGSNATGHGSPFSYDTHVPIVFYGKNVPAGEYAIAVMHDENGNEDLDFDSYGMALEGYGFSNEAMGEQGPPDFQEAAFDVSEDTEAYIDLMYMGGF